MWYWLNRFQQKGAEWSSNQSDRLCCPGGNRSDRLWRPGGNRAGQVGNQSDRLRASAAATAADSACMSEVFVRRWRGECVRVCWCDG